MKTTKFNVVLDVPLTGAQKSAINKDIQAVVARYVAKIDKGAFYGYKKIPNKEWLGIWLKRFKDINSLKKSTVYNQYKVG